MNAEEVLELVRAGGLLPAEPDGRPILAMLSGGRDSVCLLDLAVNICGAENVHALHVNYGLRPEADEEERHCRELCRRLGVASLEVVRAARPAGAGNLQAWARALRYGEAERTARELDALSGAENAGGETLIATGHTATDQVETILYRLAASPGRRALLGMSPRDGRLVRPLLELTREQTAAYCRARGLSWREDASNDDERYARARVRNHLLPALDAVHPAARENVLRTARLLREEAVVLDALVDAELERDFASLGGDARGGDFAARGGDFAAPGGDFAAPGRDFAALGGDFAAPGGGLHEGGGASSVGRPEAAVGAPSVAIERLRDLPPVLARLIVVRLAEEAAGAYVPQAGARVQEILDLAERGGRAELHVGGLVGAVIEDGRLRMVRLPPRR
jgi:tRNA(Ile)-lysidine synthetase-like protein